MKRKDTFIPKAQKGHLWIIVAGPIKYKDYPDAVLILNVTDYDNITENKLCTIEAYSHKSIKKKSAINYGEVRGCYSNIVSLKEIDNGINNGDIKHKEPIDDDLLNRIIAGAKKSQFSHPYKKIFFPEE